VTFAPEPRVVSEPEPEPEPETVVVAKAEAEPEPEPQVEVEPELPEQRLDDVAAQAVASPRIEPTEAGTPESEEVAVSLIWPEDTPLKEFADLSWPIQSEDGERGAPTDIDVVLEPLPPSLPPVFAGQVSTDDTEAPSWAEWDNPPAPSDIRATPPTVTPQARPPAVRVIPPEPEVRPKPEEPAAESPRVAPRQPEAPAGAGGSAPLLIHPVEGSPLPAQRISGTAPGGASTRKPDSTPRALRRKRTRRKVPAKLVVTVTLLALLATAVVLVLAQSAGAIHLGFLGTPG
jgi:hypothetical protein